MSPDEDFHVTVSLTGFFYQTSLPIGKVLERFSLVSTNLSTLYDDQN
jgi:hypothetical protein